MLQPTDIAGCVRQATPFNFWAGLLFEALAVPLPRPAAPVRLWRCLWRWCRQRFLTYLYNRFSGLYLNKF
jgi:hypothetical protein